MREVVKTRKMIETKVFIERKECTELVIGTDVIKLRPRPELYDSDKCFRCSLSSICRIINELDKQNGE